MHTKANSTLILWEPLNIKEEYVLNNEYSKELKTNYSAIYRTDKIIIDSFKLNNFFKTNECLHPANSKLNKWEETRLKLISLGRK